MSVFFKDAQNMKDNLTDCSTSDGLSSNSLNTFTENELFKGRKNFVPKNLYYQQKDLVPTQTCIKQKERKFQVSSLFA